MCYQSILCIGCYHILLLCFNRGGCGYGSESEGEEPADSRVTLPQNVPGRGNVKAQQSAIRLTEVFTRKYACWDFLSQFWFPCLLLFSFICAFQPICKEIVALPKTVKKKKKKKLPSCKVNFPYICLRFFLQTEHGSHVLATSNPSNKILHYLHTWPVTHDPWPTLYDSWHKHNLDSRRNMQRNCSFLLFSAWASNAFSACEDWRRIVFRRGSFSWIWWDW